MNKKSSYFINKNICYFIIITAWINLVNSYGIIKPLINFALLIYGISLLIKENKSVDKYFNQLINFIKKYFDSLKQKKHPLNKSANSEQLNESVNLEHNYNKPINIVAIISAALMIISPILPWASARSSGSFMGKTASFSTGGLSGLNTTWGILGFIISIGCIIMVYKRMKFSALLGILNLLLVIAAIIDFDSRGSSVSFGRASGSARIDPEYGIFIFALASLVYIGFTLKYLWKKNR